MHDIELIKCEFASLPYGTAGMFQSLQPPPPGTDGEFGEKSGKFVQSLQRLEVSSKSHHFCKTLIALSGFFFHLKPTIYTVNISRKDERSFQGVSKFATWGWHDLLFSET